MSLTMALPWSICIRRLNCDRGRGNTFTDRSRMMPRIPIDPASSRATSYPATFFITCPPKRNTRPCPSISVAPKTKSLTAPVTNLAGPARPLAIHPPRVAVREKYGGSKGRH